MIDAHIHVVPPNLPGVGVLNPVLRQPPAALAAVLGDQMRAAGLTHALAMGSLSAGDGDPLGVGATLQLAAAHPGNPWLTDAAEVVYKNVNVWADLSGLAVGDDAAFAAEERRDVLSDAAAAVRKAFRYAERPNRFLYGSDWPLAPMAAYRDFIRSVIPEVNHEQVFDDNARKLFGIQGDP